MMTDESESVCVFWVRDVAYEVWIRCEKEDETGYTFGGHRKHVLHQTMIAQKKTHTHTIMYKYIYKYINKSICEYM